jgi:hypothetical protein
LQQRHRRHAGRLFVVHSDSHAPPEQPAATGPYVA